MILQRDLRADQQPSWHENETLILDGEGILGLEAACASLTEPGDKVLVIDNGIYGKGFADFASMYGGIPELYHADYENTLDVDALAEYLKIITTTLTPPLSTVTHRAGC